MDWKRIVTAFATSYAQERTGRAIPPEISVVEMEEPGVWRVLFDPPILADDDCTIEIGMIVVTGEEQLKQLPIAYQEWIRHEDSPGDPPLWGWPLRDTGEAHQ